MEGRKQSHNPLLISEDAQPGHRAARGRGGIYPDTSALKHPPTVGSHETVTETEAARLVLAAADSEI